MQKNIIVFIISAFIFCSLLFGIAEAQTEEVEHYRDLLIRYTMVLGNEDLAHKIELLEYSHVEVLYEANPAASRFEKIVNELESLGRYVPSAGGTDDNSIFYQRSIAPTVTVAGEFATRYPDMDLQGKECITSLNSCYAFYVNDPISSIIYPMFSGDSDSPGYDDDRSDEQLETRMRFVNHDFHVAAIEAQTACDAAFEPILQGTFCVAAGVAAALSYETEMRLDAFEFHTGNVDSAEIEAAYENSRTILDATNKIQAILTDEKQFVDDQELLDHEKDVLTAITASQNNLLKELAGIKDQLSQQETLLEKIITTLNTPQGRRSDWNQK